MLMIGKQLTAEQRIQKCLVDIMNEPRYIALAGVLMIGDRSVRDDIPTACTNGRDEMYGRAFVDGLNDAELRFLILHESYHKLYQHLTTWKHLHDENHQLANMACDYVINIKIADDNKCGFATMPEGGLCDPKYRDMDSALVFKDLKDNGTGQQQQQPQPNGTGGDQVTPPSNTLDEHDWEGAGGLSTDELRELKRELDEAVRQGALVAGKSGVDVDRSIHELLQPQVNWRDVLRDFITTTCTGADYSTWARPNRRYLSAGLYMPTGISEKVDELVLAIDTSGSIGNTELSAFLTEVKAVCDTVRPERVRLLYWGHEVVADEKYAAHELDQLIESTKPRGGGGTDVNCVCDYMVQHNISPQATIVLTDGALFGDWGKWSNPVLWCILDNERAKPDVGKYVNIKTGDM